MLPILNVDITLSTDAPYPQVEQNTCEVLQRQIRSQNVIIFWNMK